MEFEPSRLWRLKESLLRLEGGWCPSCEQPHFPPRRVCPACNQILARDAIKYTEPKATKTPLTRTLAISND